MPEKVGICPSRATSHTSAQLVELGQTERIGAIHDERIGVGDIQARFDNRRREQHIRISGVEAMHHRSQLSLGHLPVTNIHTRLRYKLVEMRFHPLNCANAVMYKENLPATFELAQDGLTNQLWRVRT